VGLSVVLYKVTKSGHEELLHPACRRDNQLQLFLDVYKTFALAPIAMELCICTKEW
jgi:hypothetical protein